jgi:hypothetical protein
MDTFNYNAPAELFPSKGKGFRRKMVSYRRFESAAVAIRYAIEELDPDKLIGAVLEIDEDRYDDVAIRDLYASDGYPFPRLSINQEGSSV